MPAGGAILATGVEVYKLISEAHKAKVESRELAALKQPMYKIQDEYFQNKNIAAGMASGGEPLAVKDALDKQRRTGSGTSISAMLQSGAMPGDISKLFDTYDNSISTDAARDSDAQRKNIEYFMTANKDLAGQKTTQWGVNEYSPYQQKLSQLTHNVETSKQNVNDALQGIVGAVSAFGTSAGDSKLLHGNNAGSSSSTIRPSAATAPVSTISSSGTLPGLAPRDTPDFPSAPNPVGKTYTPEEISQLLQYINSKR